MTEKKETKDKQTMTRFTPSEYEKVEQKAKEEGRTVSNLIHTATMAYLNK